MSRLYADRYYSDTDSVRDGHRRSHSHGRFRSPSVDQNGRSRSRHASRSRSPFSSRLDQPFRQQARIQRPVNMDEVTDRRERDRLNYKFERAKDKLGDYRELDEHYDTQLSRTEINLIQDLPNSLPLTPESIRMLVGLVASTNAKVAQRRRQLRRLHSKVKHFASNMQKQLADWITAVDEAKARAEGRGPRQSAQAPPANKIQLENLQASLVHDDSGAGVSNNNLKVMKANVRSGQQVYFAQSAYNDASPSDSKSTYIKAPASMYAAQANHPAVRLATPADFGAPCWTYKGGSNVRDQGYAAYKAKPSGDYVALGDLFIKDADTWKGDGTKYKTTMAQEPRAAEYVKDLCLIKKSYAAPGKLATTNNNDHIWNDSGCRASINLYAHRIIPADATGVDVGGFFLTNEADVNKARLQAQREGVWVLKKDMFNLPTGPVQPGVPQKPLAGGAAPAGAPPAR
eukprot:gnl/Hemi2/14139_TR4802_c0_g1_i1.p1 gnl/Hemi2/14139_TR4802_c0_g1~~gnl/Hemi2/14139_TR4802_c0_g1_i1.p1  ORF type:complete len:458 (-),score=172.37 gnl/Hemi2/14139_TR4802_c0_g1_i1:139-1512(-)